MHLLTCDNDKLDSWLTGWRRQPPIYQESLHFLWQHAGHAQTGQPSHKSQDFHRPGPVITSMRRCARQPPSTAMADGCVAHGC